MNHLVNFFIVGEPKSGTTALASFLGKHPEIGIANPKEPHYFATDLHRESDEFHGPKNHHFPIRTTEQYEACFDKIADKRVLGEGSTHYMCSSESAANIYKYNPNAKIIVMFRNPVSFVHSLHMQYVNNGSEDELDFEAAIKLEDDRRGGHHIPSGVRCPSHVLYSERVHYAEQLQRYLAVFPKEQIQVIIMEEFNDDNKATYERALAHLGLQSPDILPEFTVVHGSKTPRFKQLHKTLNHRAVKYAALKVFGANRYDSVKDNIAKIMLKKQPRTRLDPILKASLAAQYKPEVEKLAKLINRPDLLRLWGYND